jgi:hypothetical protein
MNNRYDINIVKPDPKLDLNLTKKIYIGVTCVCVCVFIHKLIHPRVIGLRDINCSTLCFQVRW